MSAEPTITEREARKREREAFYAGALYEQLRSNHSLPSPAEHEARRRYPLPPITRPRVIERKGLNVIMRWRLVDGILEWADTDRDNWMPYTVPASQCWKFAGPIYADLLANPTETVEDEG